MSTYVNLCGKATSFAIEEFVDSSFLKQIFISIQSRASWQRMLCNKVSDAGALLR